MCYHVNVNFWRYGPEIKTREEAEKIFNIACAKYAHAYVELADAECQTIKERIFKPKRA